LHRPQNAESFAGYFGQIVEWTKFKFPDAGEKVSDEKSNQSDYKPEPEVSYTVNQDNYGDSELTSDELWRKANESVITVNQYRKEVQPEETQRERRAAEIREVEHRTWLEDRPLESERVKLTINAFKNETPPWLRYAIWIIDALGPWAIAIVLLSKV
jgi:hypothetical protein